MQTGVWCRILAFMDLNYASVLTQPLLISSLCFWHHFLVVCPFLMTCLSIEIIGILCLRQMSEITQIKVAIRKILFYILK